MILTPMLLPNSCAVYYSTGQGVRKKKFLTAKNRFFVDKILWKMWITSPSDSASPMFTTSPAPIVINRSPFWQCSLAQKLSISAKGREVAGVAALFLQSRFRDVPGGDPQRVGLAGRVNVRQDYDDRSARERADTKVREQGFGPGIRMGLEDTPDLPVRIVGWPPSSAARISVGMVGVVVNDGDAVKLTLVFKPPALCR